MAKTTIELVHDDIDGTEDAETVSFSYQGTDYTIDLAEKQHAKLEKALAPFIEAGTKVGGRRKSSSSSGPKQDLQAIRAWASENGIEVSERGRVAKSVIEQYEAAH